MKKARTQQRERLQDLAQRLGLTIRDIARIADLSEATLYHVTDETREMSGRTASRICNQLKQEKGLFVNRDWLLTGKGEMFDEKPISNQKKDEINTQPHTEKKIEEDKKDYREKYYELLEKYSELQDKYYKLIEK